VMSIGGCAAERLPNACNMRTSEQRTADSAYRCSGLS
jgi:hypothetical protein